MTAICYHGTRADIATHIKSGGVISKAVYCRIMFDSERSAEYPEHEQWIHEVAIPKLERDWGVKTEIIQGPQTYVEMFYSQFKRGKKVGKNYGWPSLWAPWCQRRLKLNPIIKWKKQQGEHTELIGLTADEKKRVVRMKGRPDVILPLVDHGITQTQAMEISQAVGLLSPVYAARGRKRLGCWMCHNQRIGELRYLREHDPELWSIMLEMDADSMWSFTPRQTLRDLDARFEGEKMSYAHDKHYEWIESVHKVKCSDLGKQVANILGYVGRGIYNAPFKTKKVDWANPQCIEVNWGHSMANWDGCYLTNLVIECHRRMIRVSIGPNMRAMKIRFWQRKSRTGSMSERLPDIEEMVKSQDEQWGRLTTAST